MRSINQPTLTRAIENGTKPRKVFPISLQKIIFVLALLGLFLPVLSYAEPFTTIEIGFESDFKEPGTKVFRTQEEFEFFWTELDRDSLPPEVDFDKEMAICVLLGAVHSGGYSIEIISVEDAEREIVVKYQTTEPRRDSMVLMVKTHPYHIVSVAKSDKTVKFEVVEKDPEAKVKKGKL